MWLVGLVWNPIKPISRITQLIVLIATTQSCQTAFNAPDLTSAELEEFVKSINVGIPPRDPFKSLVYIQNIPRFITDISDTRDCGIVPDIGIREWVESEKERWGHYKGKSLYSVRLFTEREFVEGRSEYAAALLEAIKNWSPQKWPSEKMGSYAFLSTFYADYGDFSKARSSLNPDS